MQKTFNAIYFYRNFFTIFKKTISYQRVLIYLPFVKMSSQCSLVSTCLTQEKIDTPLDNKDSKTVVEPKKYRYWSYLDVKNSEGKPQAKVHYIFKLSDVKNAVSLLKGPYLGFDMEWKPHNDSKVAIIQLSDANSIVLFHLSLMALDGTFPKPLKDLLENPCFIKCGVGVRNDGYKLFKDFGIIGSGFLELSQLAMVVDNDKWNSNIRLISLTRLAEQYLGKPLFKGSVRYSNWDEVLIFKQVHYAATDCFAGLKIFEKLNYLRLNSENSLNIPETIDMRLDSSVIGDIQKKKENELLQSKEKS
ncbi:hypothetical protein PORY_001197 [Pneumocystis oryctolagi]|uniref:Uncharacterized protein n=1 Tax=Pneumocystis oryctolagi TaxID=42067 RepID=A0ACB7CCZ5_9ASCO|nr:hypothetical protein PORY_001197 [Pneumocystis oryctolagi]